MKFRQSTPGVVVGGQSIHRERAETVVKNVKSAGKVVTDRRALKSTDRRADDRRMKEAPVAVERRKLERRVKVNRRRQIDPTTCEREYSDDEIQFMQALETYKRTSGRMFPTCSEVLEVIRNLGYTKGVPPAAPAPALVAVSSVESQIPSEMATAEGSYAGGQNGGWKEAAQLDLD